MIAKEKYEKIKEEFKEVISEYLESIQKLDKDLAQLDILIDAVMEAGKDYDAMLEIRIERIAKLRGKNILYEAALNKRELKLWDRLEDITKKEEEES